MKEKEITIDSICDINNRIASYNEFKNKNEDEYNTELKKAEKDYENLKKQMNLNYNAYLTKNFSDFKKDLNNKLSFLNSKFAKKYEYAKPNIENTINDKANNDEIKNLYNSEVSILTKLVKDLNNVEFDGELLYKDGHFGTSKRDDINYGSTLSLDSKEIRYDNDIFNTFFDEELINQIFLHQKNICFLVDLMKENFKRDFDIDNFYNSLENEFDKFKERLVYLKNNKNTNYYSNFISNDINFKLYKEYLKNINSKKYNKIPNIKNGSDEFKELLTIGYSVERLYNEKEGSNEIDYADYELKKKFPITISLRDKGSFIINIDKYYDDVIFLVNQLIIEFLLSFPPTRIHFKLVDINNKMGFSNFSILRKINDNILLDGIVRDEKGLEDAIDNIKKIKFDAEDKLKSEGITSFFDYNNKYPESPMDVYLFVLIDFPSGINSNLANKIKSIMNNGNNDGVFTILTANKNADMEYNFSEDDFIRFIYNDNENFYNFKKYNSDDTIKLLMYGKTFNLGLLDDFKPDNLGTIVSQLAKNAADSISKAIPLSNMFDYIDDEESKNISKELEIPFGQSGGNIQTLKLTNQSGPHAALIGTSGSGKSVLFHTLILDACYKYSPEELNFYLLDFKGGVEFKYYENNKLPHIKVIGLTNDLNDGLAILENINKEILKRKKLFNEIGVSNIEAYYEQGRKIPRLFIIIDEIQEILVRDERIGDKALNILSEILAIGRSFGINILWGSQSVPNIPGVQQKMMNNITNRICLKVANSDYAMNFFGDSKSLRAVDNLNRPGITGLGVIKDERTGLSVQEFRVAYSEDGEKRKKYISQILSKWADYEFKDDLFVLNDNLIPDVLNDKFYNQNFSKNAITKKSFESYLLSLGTNYISGESELIEIHNTKYRENLVITGTNIDLLRDMMGYSLLSILLNRINDSDYLKTKNKIYYINKEGINPKYLNDLYNILPKLLKDQIELNNNEEKIINLIKDLYYAYLNRKELIENGKVPENYSSIYVFIHSIQNLSDLFDEDMNLEENDFLNFDDEFSNKSSIKFNYAFKTLLKKGSEYGIHFVISIDNVDSIREIRNELIQSNNKILTIGANPSSFIDGKTSQIPSILNDKTALIYSNNEMKKIRVYRYDEQSEEHKKRIESLIQKYFK